MPLNLHSFSLDSFDPLAVYQTLCPEGPGLLESLNPQPATGRYSIVPLRQRESYRYDQGRLLRHTGQKGTVLAGEPLATLAAILRDRALPATAETPFPGGFFGYFSYDLAGLIEDLPARARRDIPLPVLQLAWVDIVATYDHQHARLTLTSLDPTVDLTRYETPIRNAQQPLRKQPLTFSRPPQPLMTAADFCSRVRRAQAYIAAGDVYQVNLSCRFDAGLEGASTELYRRLRQINPAPFACLLKFPDVDIISSSPERLVSLSQGLAQTRPIAGTRPRGFSPARDQELGNELLCHPKERAEHIMLMDLERNDLGKVCRPGSVAVDELMVLERYSHVTHIVSNIRGQLRSDCDPFDLLQATFPGGTITGVPKKRCMEIIDELEPVGRGSYTGSAGYISVCGNMDLNILIRGFQRCGSQLSYQTGAGIVADSVPSQEWRECLHKGHAMRALLTQGGS